MEKTASEIVMVKKNVRQQEWKRQIEEQRTSGLSVQEWCKQNGINLKTYYYHLRKGREEFLTDLFLSQIFISAEVILMILKRYISMPNPTGKLSNHCKSKTTDREGISCSVVFCTLFI